MSLNADDQCITSMLVQAGAGVETIHAYLNVDKRTIGKHIKRNALAPTATADPNQKGTAPHKAKPLPKEVPPSIHRIAQEFVRTQDEEPLDDAMHTLDHQSTILLIRHIAQLLETQASGAPDGDEENS